MTHVVLLAGGRSTRLHGFDENRPKCLATVGGETILSRHLAGFPRIGEGDDHLFVSVGTELAARLVQEVIGASPAASRATVVINPANSGVVPALAWLLRHLPPAESLCLALADMVLIDGAVADLLPAAPGVSLLTSTDPASATYSAVLHHDTGAAHLRKAEAGEAGIQWAGVVCFGPAAMAAMSSSLQALDGTSATLAEDLINRTLGAAGQARLVPVQAAVNVNTLDDLAYANELLRRVRSRSDAIG